MASETTAWCRVRGYQNPVLHCFRKCPKFPCAGITDAMEERLVADGHADRALGRYLNRRKRMYVFRMADGELRDAPKDFDPASATPAVMDGVVEVLCIGKVLVPQTRLVAKGADTRPPSKPKAKPSDDEGLGYVDPDISVGRKSIVAPEVRKRGRRKKGDAA